MSRRVRPAEVVVEEEVAAAEAEAEAEGAVPV